MLINFICLQYLSSYYNKFHSKNSLNSYYIHNSFLYYKKDQLYHRMLYKLDHTLLFPLWIKTFYLKNSHKNKSLIEYLNYSIYLMMMTNNILLYKCIYRCLTYHNINLSDLDMRYYLYMSHWRLIDLCIQHWCCANSNKAKEII